MLNNKILLTMEDLKEKVGIVKYYMKNMSEFRDKFWENFKSIKLKDKSEKYINDVSGLIDEWIDNGEINFCNKYK